jgi:hypothetical protein
MSDPLDGLAYRASAEPFFLGHALTRAQLDLGLSDGGTEPRRGGADRRLTPRLPRRRAPAKSRL